MQTIPEIELKQWLNRAFYADKKAKALEMLVSQCRERAQGLSRSGEGNDTGKSDGVKNGTENALMKLAEMEKRFERQKVECVNISDEISKAIEKLHDLDLETVLVHRYLLFHTIEQTAEIMNYSPRAVRHKQKKAIEKLCLLLPCFASSDDVQ